MLLNSVNLVKKFRENLIMSVCVELRIYMSHLVKCSDVEKKFFPTE